MMIFIVSFPKRQATGNHNMPKQNLPISVVICAYNAEKYLEGSLQNIREQTYRNLEILVIDDASTDGTGSIARAIAKKDKRIRIIRLKRNGGIAHARQIGLEKACRDWLLFFDADDIALPAMIERQVDVLKSDKNIIGVSTFSYFVGEDEKIIAEQRVGIKTKDDFFKKYTEKKLMFLLPNTLFSKKLAIKVGGYRLKGFPDSSSVRFQDFSEDVDLWCRLSDLGSEGKYLVTVSEPLFKYRKTMGSLSTANVFHMQEKMRWIKDCLVHRRSNVPERSFDNYRKEITFIDKLSNLRSDCAAYCYKRMAFYYLRRQYLLAAPLFAFVLSLDPVFIFQKLKTQKIKVS